MKILIKVVNKTIEIEPKEQKGGFFGMLLVILRISLLGNMLSGELAKERLEMVNFEMQKYYQKEPRVFFNK